MPAQVVAHVEQASQPGSRCFFLSRLFQGLSFRSRALGLTSGSSQVPAWIVLCHEYGWQSWEDFPFLDLCEVYALDKKIVTATATRPARSGTIYIARHRSSLRRRRRLIRIAAQTWSFFLLFAGTLYQFWGYWVLVKESKLQRITYCPYYDKLNRYIP